MTTEKPTGLALLRVPFPPHQISKLPKPTIKNEEWKKLPRAKCSECGGYHPMTKTIHLDYVGHAALTDRLLDADPNWSWEPLAFGPDGLPIIDANGGMWIKLTVCGVTRYGYGDASDKTGPLAVKERIGDALRNAAMRFGAALELWHKGELHAEEEEPKLPIEKQIHAANVKPNAGAGDNLLPEQRKRVDDLSREVIDCFAVSQNSTAYDVIDEAQLNNEEKLYLWSLLGSSIRSALKTIGDERKKALLQREEATQP